MEFEKMIGTTGVTTDETNLYIANNTVISVIDSNLRKTDYPHSYGMVKVLTVGPKALYGIYTNGTVKGLFQMNLTTHVFLSTPVQYNPVFIYYLKNSATEILVFDDSYQIYRYDASLVLKTGGTPLPSNLKPNTFITFGMTQANDTSYYATNDKIIDLNTFQYLPLTLTGNIWGIHYYLQFLFIIYLSDYNQYSIIQYDPVLKKVVKKVDGENISGPPLYSCIYKNSVLVSTTVNKSYPMSLFSVPGLTSPTATTNSNTVTGNAYPLFDLIDNTPHYLDEQTVYQMEGIQKRFESLKPDKQPAENAYLSTYLWGSILLILVIMFILVVTVQETTTIHKASMLIIILSLIFIMYYYI